MVEIIFISCQVLSHSVAAGISLYAQCGKLGEGAEATAFFVEKMNNLFDLFNSSRKFGEKTCGKRVFFRTLSSAPPLFTLSLSAQLSKGFLLPSSSTSPLSFSFALPPITSTPPCFFPHSYLLLYATVAIAKCFSLHILGEEGQSYHQNFFTPFPTYSRRNCQCSLTFLLFCH